MSRQWDRTDHEKAFRIWCETHNWSRVHTDIGCNYETPRRWAEDDFQCKDGCPWHGWDRLEREKQASLQAQVELIEQGNFNPTEHDRAIRRVLMGGPSGPNRAELIKRTIRSDLERAAHWEMIWAKAFYTATGQVVEWSQFNGGESIPPEVFETMQQTLRQGMSPTSFHQCVQAMKMAQEQIDLIRGRPQRRKDEEEATSQEFSVEDLRNLRAKMKAGDTLKLRDSGSA